jgi:uncharacterized membrane protein
MLHVTAAFLFVGGSVAAGILNTLAVLSDLPSEVAALLRLIRRTLPVLFVGVLGTLVFGIWLWHEAGYSLGAAWIWLSLALWAVANALGGIGGRRQEQTRELAERLAEDGDQPSTELHAALRDPVAHALNYGAGLATLAILALMVWRPGS